MLSYKYGVIALINVLCFRKTYFLVWNIRKRIITLCLCYILSFVSKLIENIISVFCIYLVNFIGFVAKCEDYEDLLNFYHPAVP